MGICALALALLLAAPGWGYSGRRGMTAPQKTASVEGTIYFVNPNGSVTIIPDKERIEEAPRAVILADSRTSIFRDRKPAKVGSLREGDEVRAVYDPATGTAITIRVNGR